MLNSKPRLKESKIEILGYGLQSMCLGEKNIQQKNTKVQTNMKEEAGLLGESEWPLLILI